MPRDVTTNRFIDRGSFGVPGTLEDMFDQPQTHVLGHLRSFFANHEVST